MLIEVISDMNSSYENRKHGGYSQIAEMQMKMLEAYPQIGLENFYTEEYYFPIGQKIEPGTLENLKMVCDEYQTQMNLSSNLRK